MNSGRALPTGNSWPGTPGGSGARGHAVPARCAPPPPVPRPGPGVGRPGRRTCGCLRVGRGQGPELPDSGLRARQGLAPGPSPTAPADLEGPRSGPRPLRGRARPTPARSAPPTRSPSSGPGSRPAAPAASPQLGAPTPPPSLSLARPPRRNWARVASSGRSSALRASPAETEALLPLPGLGERWEARGAGRPQAPPQAPRAGPQCALRGRAHRQLGRRGRARRLHVGGSRSPLQLAVQSHGLAGVPGAWLRRNEATAPDSGFINPNPNSNPGRGAVSHAPPRGDERLRPP